MENSDNFCILCSSQGAKTKTMKKNLLVSAFVGLIFVACSDASEDFTVAAKTLCTCMNQHENADDESMLKVNLGVCLLDAGVDLKDPQMSKAVAAHCPELKAAFDDYVKNL